MYIFEELDKLDYRSRFANIVCKLIYQKHKGNLTDALSEVYPLLPSFDYIINIEFGLVDSEIPLYALHNLREIGIEKFENDQKLYDLNEKVCIDACELYYKL